MFFLVLEKLGTKRSAGEAAVTPGEEPGVGSGGALQAKTPQAPAGKPGNE